jgi:heme A synthase
MTSLDSRTDLTTSRGASALFSSVIGLASIAILLQAVWAGLFVHEGKEYTDSWVEVHARGADIAIVLAAVAAVIAFVRLRQRRELWIGSAALTVLLIVEAYIGGIIGDHSKATIIHFPLAMALMGLAVWLPVRAAARPRV